MNFLHSLNELLTTIYLSPIFVISVTSFAVVLLVVLLLVNFFAYQAIRRFLFIKTFYQRNRLALMNNAPGISIITGAYNESATIIDNVHSLLSINYHKFELIVVNDGSKDDTLEKLINEFHLDPIVFEYDTVIKSKPIKKIYKSRNLAFRNLVVIDKINGGGKADAINAGLNLSKYNYFLNIDVDCILDFNTLLIMMEVILNEKHRCIGVGATLRMSNASFVSRGTIEKVGVPRKLFVRFQELEYIRSFVLGKMAWSHLNALPNISGGLGLFDKEIVLNIGGYSHDSLGEDMDLLFRMVNYMLETKQKYVVRSIPQTLCWTEGPESLKDLVRQRIRWSRGLIQILKQNRRVFFNPRYGKMGWIIYPYNVFFEFLSPFVEFIGYFLLLFFFIFNKTIFFGLLMVAFTVVSFYIALSFISVLLDRKIAIYYKTTSSAIGIAFMAFLEPILYHPIIVYCALRGTLDELTGKKKSWGEMKRKGFNQTK